MVLYGEKLLLITILMTVFIVIGVKSDFELRCVLNNSFPAIVSWINNLPDPL